AGSSRRGLAALVSREPRGRGVTSSGTGKRSGASLGMEISGPDARQLGGVWGLSRHSAQGAGGVGESGLGARTGGVDWGPSSRVLARWARQSGNKRRRCFMASDSVKPTTSSGSPYQTTDFTQRPCFVEDIPIGESKNQKSLLEGFPRSRFVSDRMRFAASRRRREPCVGLVFRRGLGGCKASSIMARRRSKQSLRLRC